MVFVFDIVLCSLAYSKPSLFSQLLSVDMSVLFLRISIEVFCRQVE